MMKKLFSLMLSLLLVLSLVPGSVRADEPKELRIAIVQQMDHASLDEIRTAIEGRLTEIAREQDLTLSFKSFNGQNDASNAGSDRCADRHR